MTLREAATELARIALETRDVAARLDGLEANHWAIARDVRAIAYSLERYAGIAERAGVSLGEPEPGRVAVSA